MARYYGAVIAVVVAMVLPVALLWPSTGLPYDADRVESFHFKHHLLNSSIRSWEEGVWTEALLEVHNPELTIFSSNPFLGGEMTGVPEDAIDSVAGLASAARYIWTNGTLLCEGEGMILAKIARLNPWCIRLTSQAHLPTLPRSASKPYCFRGRNQAETSLCRNRTSFHRLHSDKQNTSSSTLRVSD